MTFRTFEQLDQEAGQNALFFDYAKKPARPDTAGYDTPETLAKAQEVADRSVVAAAFRQDNIIGSLMSRKDLGVDNTDDKTFDPVTYIKEHNLTGYEDSFMGVLNSRKADAIKSQIEMENRDRETLQAAGWAGTFAQIAAGVFDAPTLIPGSVAVRGARGAWSVGRSVLMAGASAAATQAATEGFLQASQQTRTAEESFLNIGSAAVMGSLLGGGIAAVLGKNERIAAEKALANISDIQSGAKPNEFVPAHILDQRGAAAGGADVADGAFFVDPVQKARTREELAVEGIAATAAIKATSTTTEATETTTAPAAATAPPTTATSTSSKPTTTLPLPPTAIGDDRGDMLARPQPRRDGNGLDPGHVPSRGHREVGALVGPAWVAREQVGRPAVDGARVG